MILILTVLEGNRLRIRVGGRKTTLYLRDGRDVSQLKQLQILDSSLTCTFCALPLQTVTERTEKERTNIDLLQSKLNKLKKLTTADAKEIVEIDKQLTASKTILDFLTSLL